MLNNILKTLQAGMESSAYESEKDPIFEEISMEATIDDLFEKTMQASLEASVAGIEATAIMFAEREIGENNDKAAEVYQGYGMEAITDVVKRKAYSGVATIKALIKSLIAALKKVLGFSTVMKKVAKSLANKAKATKKELVKVSAKMATKEKDLDRDIVDYDKLFDVAIKDGLKKLSAFVGVDVKDNADLDALVELLKKENSELDLTPEGFKTKSEELKEVLADKSSKSNNELLTVIMKGLGTLEANKSVTDIGDLEKGLDKFIKELDKFYKEIDKLDESAKLTATKNLQTSIANLSVASSYVQLFTKTYVKVADEVLTDAKWLLARAM